MSSICIDPNESSYSIFCDFCMQIMWSEWAIMELRYINIIIIIIIKKVNDEFLHVFPSSPTPIFPPNPQTTPELHTCGWPEATPKHVEP